MLSTLGGFVRGVSPCTLELHDPLGLSYFETDDAVVTPVPRTWEESMEWARFFLPPQPHADGGQYAIGREAVTRLVDLLSTSSRVVALTGAGVSTESGVVPFRDSGTDSAAKHGCVAGSACTVDWAIQGVVAVVVVQPLDWLCVVPAHWTGIMCMQSGGNVASRFLCRRVLVVG